MVNVTAELYCGWILAAWRVPARKPNDCNFKNDNKNQKVVKTVQKKCKNFVMLTFSKNTKIMKELYVFLINWNLKFHILIYESM